jgi:phage terminase small subunit
LKTLFIVYKKDKKSYPYMNERQSLFVSEYLKTGNASESAIRAGYSKKTAYSIGQRLLKNVEIQKEIDRHRDKISQKAELTVSDIVKEIRALALDAESDSNRLKAYDMLMKHLGGYKNEVKIIEGLSEEQLDEICIKLNEMV